MRALPLQTGLVGVRAAVAVGNEGRGLADQDTKTTPPVKDDIRKGAMRTAKRFALPLVIVGLLLGGGVGCAPRQGEPPEPREEPEPVVSVTARTPSPYPSVADASGVARDVVIARCDLQAGDAVASGTVVNTAMRPADFAITIIWLPLDSADPVAVASTTVPAVERAATVAWSITTVIPDQAGRCAVNARRGELR